MYSYSAVQWLFFFYFYCFFGWCFESTYVSIKNRKLVNRGFMRGPFLPLYGSGAIMMLVVSMPFQNNILMVYVSGCIGATVLEYVTGVTMEALFKVRYWDYSHQKFNFQGHICLGSSLAWGFLTILMTEMIHKPIEYVILGIPGMALAAMTAGLTLLIGSDFILSFKTALDLRSILVKMEEAKGELLRVQKRLDVIIAVANEEIALKKEALSEKTEALAEAISDVIARGREGLSESFELKMEESTVGKSSRKGSLTGNVGERLEELAGSIGDRMDDLSESIGEKMDDLSESLGGRMDDLSESFENRMKEIAEQIEERVEEFSENVETRIEDLKKSIEEKFKGIKGISKSKDSSYLDKREEELGQLRQKYRRNVDDRERLGHIRSFYQRNMLRSNPTMSSVRFREALEELKRKAGLKNPEIDKNPSDVSGSQENEESQEGK